MDDTSTNQQSSHLYALMLKLRPRAAGEVLPNAGQLAHAALLAWLKEVDPALAARLHEPNNDRPFTCSSLWFPDERAVALAQRDNRRLPIHPMQTYWLRLTLLTDELFRTLTARFLRPVAPATHDDLGLPTLRLGGVHFDVAELIALPPGSDSGQPAPLSWAGYDTYEGLVMRARSLDRASPVARSLTIEFRSPTAFSDGQRAWGKRMHLFPDADRVFDRLAHVWNAWAPSALALEPLAIQAYAREWVAVAQYDLHTRTLHFDRHAQVGFVGHCTFALMDVGRAPKPRIEEASSGEAQPTRDLAARAVGADLTPARALHLLAAFSFYAGIGQKTTMGMGQARPLPHPSAGVPIGERTHAVTPALRVAGATADAARA
ncbi:MAG TPA: CRISPR system precrRNA processing endoribonuclease RAMP protein Cas6 [Ktedonobacterales bacterium]